MGGLLFALIVPVLGGCRTAAPEQRLREPVARMQAAVTCGEVRDFMGTVAEDYGMDRVARAPMLRAHRLVHRELGLHARRLAIEMGTDTAVVRFAVVSTGRWLPGRGQLHFIISGWRQVDGQWQLHHAQWQPQGDAPLR
ncbi:hypothetical protein [Stenotrophomonas sp. YIM B06876]|uniref:hypothetical protein n=1 Tax=Stenotrophomonas sp. YIM B06876 TaxID=3060211 RepID=UPI002738A87E|nr:hypothetical protein [Stenotrophomonas sp. YIM B06876]